MGSTGSGLNSLITAPPAGWPHVDCVTGGNMLGEGEIGPDESLSERLELLLLVGSVRTHLPPASISHPFGPIS